ncbi:DUF2334 domain-containing protein [Rhodococcus marinonascens]|uniref:DUF2334 domain-containing protein n=1 Tax=Rhodococcus marinonascens TaxID=38311 RepID=UPI0009333606|nr:DUF2334 domain-containing protein [Rhodococcus marinonascens]
MTGQLIVSVSGIKDETRDFTASFAEEMDSRGVPLSLLVAPRLKDKYRLVNDPETQNWLRKRRSLGDAVLLHGYDQAATKRRRAEFATLPEHEARLRLLAADRVMEQTGLRTRLFAPPRWLASQGAVAALPSVGFRLLAGKTAIHDLTRRTDLTCETSVRSRVLRIDGGFRAEPLWCRALLLGIGRTAKSGGLVRLAVTAKQLGVCGPRQALLDAVDLALDHSAHPVVYRWRPRTPHVGAA